MRVIEVNQNSVVLVDERNRLHLVSNKIRDHEPNILGHYVNLFGTQSPIIRNTNQSHNIKCALMNHFENVFN